VSEAGKLVVTQGVTLRRSRIDEVSSCRGLLVVARNCQDRRRQGGWAQDSFGCVTMFVPGELGLGALAKTKQFVPDNRPYLSLVRSADEGS
jgi:hypothetical protein